MDAKIDKRGILEENVFSYKVGKKQKVFIYYKGKRVTILNGKKADDFVSKINNMTGIDTQLIMAKATGNFKRGNEKLLKQKY